MLLLPALASPFTLACALVVPSGGGGGAGDVDTDRDGLSDFDELHKYFTDPKRADTDGDGIPDGDWDERREYAYSVRAVIDVMAPFDVATMNDDYQDVRVLERRPDLLEFEGVVYPFNTVADAIAPDPGWRKPKPELQPFLAPGTCCNWDAETKRQLEADLLKDGIDVAKLDDVAAVRKVSKWLNDRAAYDDSFTTFCVEFEKGVPHVTPRQASDVEATLRKSGRTLEEQWDRELFGKGMLKHRIRGSCTSSAIYLSTGLKAIGIPTRSIVCIPLVDASDAREVSWIPTRLTHLGVRKIVQRAAARSAASWTSHTFNEVFVGGRWRRLNYDRLGQNVLDADYLGLMVHVHTFADHSEAGLAGWGDRMAHPLHDALFGGPNPYSCVSLSDRFGVHAKVENPPVDDALRELPIARVYWYDDPARDRKLDTTLGGPQGSAYFVAHVDTPASGQECLEFFDAVGKDFVLRAKGRVDVRAGALMKYWIDGSRQLNDFILQIEPEELARMESGVAYELVASGEGGALRWKVRDGVRLTRPKR
jgi:hypothetical protein